MKRAWCPVLFLLIVCGSAGICVDGWESFVAADGSFSLQYPAGWQVTEQPSAVIIDSGDGQQIVVLAVPYRAGENAEEHGRRMVALLATGNAGLTARNWRMEDGSAARAEISFTDAGVAQLSDVIVIKDDDAQEALWFSYAAPAARYDRPAALQILQTLIESLAAGEEAGPAGDIGVLSLEEQQIVNGFLFTVEFSLGQSLDLQSEQVVARELVRGWRQGTSSAEEMSMYPMLVEQIMSLDQAQLDELQKDLHGVLIEWLNETAPNDLVVAILQQRLEAGQQVVAGDEPALTAVAAQAYAEMFALSELLHREPEAGLSDISAEVVAEIREQLTAAWPTLSAEERQQVLTVPGLWGVLRHALVQGAGEHPTQARDILLGLTPAPAPAAAAGTGAAGQDAGGGDDIRSQMTRSFIYGETLRQMQQQTFNTWRWSMGYCRGPMGF